MFILRKTFNKVKSELNKVISSLKNDVDYLKNKNKKLTTEFCMVSEELALSKTMIISLKEELSLAKKTNSSFQEELELIKETNSSLNTQVHFLKTDMDYLECVNRDLENSNSELNFKLGSMIVSNLECMDNESISEVYSKSQSLDNEKWIELDIIERKTGINISNFYYYEDNLGYFENLDGNGLIPYYEKAKFGEFEYDLCSGGYESSVCVSDYWKHDEYKTYRLDVEKEVVYKLALLNPIALCDYL